MTVIRVLAHTKEVGCDGVMYALYRYVQGSRYVIDCHITGALLKIPLVWLTVMAEYNMCSSMIISHYSMVMVIETLSDLLSGIDVVKCPYSPTDHETVST